MRTYTESAGGHFSGYMNMSRITGKENSGWIPDSFLRCDPPLFLTVEYYLLVKCFLRDPLTKSSLATSWTRS